MLGVAGCYLLYDGNADRVMAAKLGRKVNLPANVLLSGRIPILGRPDAPFFLVEFLDYQCGPCRGLASKIERFTASGRVALVIRHLPGEQSHPFARRAAAYVAGMNDSEAAREAHQSMMKLRWSEEGWREFMAKSPIPTVSPTVVDRLLAEDRAAANAALVQATPTLFLVHGSDVYEVFNPDEISRL